LITVFFRYDDYSALSPPKVDRGLISVLRKNSMSATFAVVPSITIGSYHDASEREELKLAGDKVIWLKQACEAGIVDCALHGWNHRSVTGAPPHSEFCGRSLEQQEARIRRGRDFLAQQIGIAARVFVPPWNSYDRDTIRALEGAGIRCLSANRYFPYLRSSKIVYAPITVEIKDLRLAIEYARVTRDQHAIVGVLLHPYDFHESGDARAVASLEKLGQELKWLRSQSDVSVQSISALVESGQQVDAKRYHSNQPSWTESIAPPFVTKTYDTPVYLSGVKAYRAKSKRVLASVVPHLVIAGIAFAAAAVLLTPFLQYRSLTGELVYSVLGGVTAILLVRVLRSRKIYFNGMAAMAGLVGIWGAILF